MSDSDGGWSWDDEQAAQQQQLAADLAARTTAPTQEIAQASARASARGREKALRLRLQEPIRNYLTCQ